MPALEVEIINKVTNISALAEEKAALSGALGGGGFSPLGGGKVNFGGSLTRAEQATAAEQLALVEANAKKAGAGFAEFEGKLKSAVVVSGQAGAITDGLARKMSALGALGLTPATFGLIGVTIAAAGFVEAGKSMIDNAEQNEVANKNLAQAYAYLGDSVPTKKIDDFINQNERFIPSIYDAKNGFASLARAGFDTTTQFRLMNDALNLSAVKNESLSDAVAQLIKAHGGSGKALLDLGIVMKDIKDPVKNLALAHKDVTKATDEHSKAVRALQEWEAKHHDRSKLTEADLMHEQDLKIKVTTGTKDLSGANEELAYAQNLVKDKGDKFQALLDTLEPKIKHGRDNISDLQQSSNHLGGEWKKLSDDYGPGLVTGLGYISDRAGDAVSKVDDFLGLLKNDSGPAFNSIDGFLTGSIRNWQGMTKAISDATDAFEHWLIQNGITTKAGSQAGKGGKFGKNPAANLNRSRGFAPGTAPVGKGGK